MISSDYQAELFAFAAKKLEGVVKQFPPDKVQQIRSRIDGYIKQGGVQIIQEKSNLEIGLEIASGKALPSDYMKSEEEVKAAEEQKKIDEER